MNARDLDQRVVLLRREVADSGTGSRFQIEEFVDEATVGARVIPVRGGEAFLNVQRTASVTHRFTIRFRSDVSEAWRVRWRGEEFNVTELTPFGRQMREWLDVLATASPAENPVE